MKKLLLFIFVLVIFAAFPLLSQENIPNTGDQAEPAESETTEAEAIPFSLPDDDGLYIIAAFEFDIKGRTRPDALIYNGEFKQGEKLQGRENFEKYIRGKTQDLTNMRILKDNASIDYSIGEQMEDGAYPVTLTIKVEDSWNIIALPRPKYTTSNGFDLTIKARDYNFLGRMEPLRVDLGYTYDENHRHSFNFMIDSDTPFHVFGYTWNINFDNLFSYRPNVDEPFYYQNVTGLSMELPFKNTTFTFGFDEYVNLNEENSDRYKAQYGEFQSGVYMSSKLYTSWKIPTGIEVYKFGELTYNANISTTFNHEFEKWPLHDFRKGPFMGFTHSLSFEKVDWHANYKEGLAVSLDNAYSYDFYRLKNDKEPVSLSFSLTGAGYYIVSDFFAIYSRLQYRQWFYHDPEYNDQAGDVLRGVADWAISADYMLSLNMDFPVRLLIFEPSRWFKTSKLRFFDFELQASPVIDMAIYHDPLTGTSFSPKNIAVTVGGELIVFPAFMRNLYIRFGYAADLREVIETKKLPDGANREAYLMMGHFY